MKTRFLALCVALLPLMACGNSAGAQAEIKPAPAAAIKPDDPRVALAAKIPGAHPEDLRPTPVPGIYELTHGADISYVTADAKYVFSGDLFRITTQGDFPNLTGNAARRDAAREARGHPRIRNAGVWPGQCRAHHHRVHGRRLPLVPQAALAAGRLQQARHPRALPVLPAHGSRYTFLVQGRGRVVARPIATRR
ncbi:MAG: disulfide isomerase DsbC N-terminal domain-containing protein [Pseudomonadota bacterium]